jgi:hypothetical protein
MTTIKIDPKHIISRTQFDTFTRINYFVTDEILKRELLKLADDKTAIQLQIEDVYYENVFVKLLIEYETFQFTSFNFL